MAGTQRVGKGKNGLLTDGVSFQILLPPNIPFYLFHKVYFVKQNIFKLRGPTPKRQKTYTFRKFSSQKTLSNKEKEDLSLVSSFSSILVYKSI